jgi:hypothetical protein
MSTHLILQKTLSGSSMTSPAYQTNRLVFNLPEGFAYGSIRIILLTVSSDSYVDEAMTLDHTCPFGVTGKIKEKAGFRSHLPSLFPPFFPGDNPVSFLFLLFTIR